MAQTTAKRSVMAVVDEKASRRQCLCCERRAKLRGLCPICAHRFYRALKQQSNEQAQSSFENECIRNGLILPVGQQRKLAGTDPFSRLSASRAS